MYQRIKPKMNAENVIAFFLKGKCSESLPRGIKATVSNVGVVLRPHFFILFVVLWGSINTAFAELANNPLPVAENQGAASADPWRMQGHDAQRTSRSSSPGPVKPTLKWTYNLPFPIQDNASPIVSTDGTIYITDSAINADGTLKGTAAGIGGRKALALSSDSTKIYSTIYEGDYLSSQKLISLDIQGDMTKAIAGGSAHSLFLKRDGTVWAAGDNYKGQLGNGTNTASNLPVKVINLSNVTAIAAGGFDFQSTGTHEGHSLALKGDGTVWAWGYNGYGQLGNGTTSDSNTPVRVSNLNNIVAIAAGDEGFSLALRGDGTVWAWGYNYSGQLGNGTNTNSPLPVQVSYLNSVIAIAAGKYHALALRQDGTAWAWGDNSWGQLGNGSHTNTNYPVQVSNLTNVVAMAGAVQVIRWP